MNRITVEQLSQDTYGIMALVERGESFVIIRDGKPAARLEPVGQAVDDVTIGIRGNGRDTTTS